METENDAADLPNSTCSSASTSSSGGHWNCFVAGCTSSHYTVKKEIQETGTSNLKHFRIPKNHLAYYKAFFKTDHVNWKYAFICSLHWSSTRKNFNHLPDVRDPQMKTPQVKKRMSPYARAKKKNTYAFKQERRRREVIVEKNEEIEIQRDQNEENRKKICMLEEENIILKNQVGELKREILNNRSEESSIMIKLDKANKEIDRLKDRLAKQAHFAWDKVDGDSFRYMTGMEKDEFVCVFDLFQPYVHLIDY